MTYNEESDSVNLITGNNMLLQCLGEYFGIFGRFNDSWYNIPLFWTINLNCFQTTMRGSGLSDK